MRATEYKQGIQLLASRLRVHEEAQKFRAVGLADSDPILQDPSGSSIPGRVETLLNEPRALHYDVIQFLLRFLNLNPIPLVGQITPAMLEKIIDDVEFEATCDVSLQFLLELTLESETFSGFVLTGIGGLLTEIHWNLTGSQFEFCLCLIANLLSDSPESFSPELCDFLLKSTY
jgi:hypothetical protein